MFSGRATTSWPDTLSRSMELGADVRVRVQSPETVLTSALRQKPEKSSSPETLSTVRSVTSMSVRVMSPETLSMLMS